MAFELREGQGNLFRNERREKPEHPNPRGEALIGGTRYEIPAWTKQGTKGAYQSLSIKPKQQAQSRPRQDRDDPRTSYGTRAEELDAEIPF